MHACEIDLQKATYEMLDKMAKSLNMKGIEELLSRELAEGIDNLELWLDRYHILRIHYPSLFSVAQKGLKKDNLSFL